MSDKRHIALQDLSRDHRLFLREARHIRWYLEADERAKSLEEVIESLLTFWDDIGLLHIREEEEIVYPVYVKVAPLRKREIDALYTDHNWLRDKMQELGDLPRFENSKPVLHSMSEYIVNHVRHEENVIYESIQTKLSEKQLNAIAEKSLAFRKKHRKVNLTHHSDLPDLGEV